MARTRARLADGLRLTDLISLGVVGQAFPLTAVRAAVAASGKESQRQRLLPAHVVVYYVIALSLFMQVSCQEVLRCLLEGLQWLSLGGARLTVAGDSGISQARSRLGPEPVRRLHEAVVVPIARAETRGAWYHRWRLVSLDGSTLELQDSAANAAFFGRPQASRGHSAFPQLRFVSLVENGTHVLFGSAWGPYQTAENPLAARVLPHLKPGMLCLADRGFYGFASWQRARATGADLLWRVKRNLRLPDEKRLEDGSFLTTVYANDQDRNRRRQGVVVRAVEYQLESVADAEPVYRLITTVLDPEPAPADELAALYHERWEIETALDELKTHLRGSRIVLRSRTPELVEQEFYGLMMAHYAVRGLMHEAALKADVDPDTLSFVHTVRVIRRKLPRAVALPPSGPSDLPSTAPGRDPRTTGGFQPGQAQPPGGETQDEQLPAPPEHQGAEASHHPSNGQSNT